MIGRLLAMLALVVLAGFGGEYADAVVSATAVPRRNGAEFEDFPLWKDIPVKAFAVVGEGRVRGTRWAAYVFRGASKREGGKRPCIDVAHIAANGAYGYSTECGPLAPVQGPDVPPVFALSGGNHSNGAGGPIGESLIGVTFAPQVVEVRFELDSDMSIARPTSYLSRRQSKKAHVRRFRYIAMGLAQDVCIKRVTGVDAQGRTVLDAATGECVPSA